jgi:hypothetical protein
VLSTNLANGKKLTKLQAEAVAMMPEIVAASVAESGYVFKSAFDVAYLVENGLVEQNEGIVNEAGEFATRATEAGIAALNATVQTNTATAETKVEEPKPERKVKMSFEIEKGIPVPKTTRGGARTSAYPFAELELNDSFFIAASEKHPEPEKSLASTVSGATKRYDVPVEGETKEVRNPKTQEVKTVPKTAHTRIFVIRKEVKADGTVGARVFRTL